jgi:hypothetical protein
MSKKTLFALIIDFSFLPQVIWAAITYKFIAFDSAVLIETGLQAAFLIVFIEIVVLAVLTAIKRFYLIRFLLLAAYVQLILTVVINEFYNRLFILGGRLQFLHHYIFVFAAGGILFALLNLYALYRYRKIKKEETKHE